MAFYRIILLLFLASSLQAMQTPGPKYKPFSLIGCASLAAFKNKITDEIISLVQQLPEELQFKAGVWWILHCKDHTVQEKNIIIDYLKKLDLSHTAFEHLLLCSQYLNDASQTQKITCNDCIARHASTNKSTMLYAALENGFYVFAKLLLKYGASPHRGSWHTNNAPLHIAVFTGNTQCIYQLLKAGADINAYNNEGNTPLHEAVNLSIFPEQFNEQLNVIQFLRQHGAQTIKNIYNQFPKDIFLQNGEFYSDAQKEQMLALLETANSNNNSNNN
jgi:ankyrin repeat protein